MINKTGSAKWTGGLKSGTGEVSTQSGALSSHPYGFNTRFEDKPGTNPEELIGAAHAACFSMALALGLEKAGIGDVSIETRSRITLEQQGDGFTITKAHLTARVASNGDKARVEEIAAETKDACPVSKVLNADITLELEVA